MNRFPHTVLCGVRRICLAGGAVLLLCASAGVAYAQTIVDERPAARNSISGSVQLERKGPPPERLLVTLVPDAGGGRIEAWTDSVGRFVFEDLRPGDYSIAVRAPYGSQFADGSQRVTLYEGYTPTNYSVVVTLGLRVEPGTPAPSPATTSVDPDAAVPAEARKLWKKGVEAAAVRKNSEAVDLFRKALAIAPEYTAALNDLGAEYLRQGKLDEARPLLERAAERARGVFAPQMNLALVLFDLKDYRGARTAVERALSLDSGSSRALWISGELLMVEGRLVDAIATLERAFERGGDTQAAVSYALGRAYDASGARTRAIEYYRMAIALEPGSARGAAASERIAVLAP